MVCLSKHCPKTKKYVKKSLSKQRHIQTCILQYNSQNIAGLKSGSFQPRIFATITNYSESDDKERDPFINAQKPSKTIHVLL